jgi:hypothetical protein
MLKSIDLHLVARPFPRCAYSCQNFFSGVGTNICKKESTKKLKMIIPDASDCTYQTHIHLLESLVQKNHVRNYSRCIIMWYKIHMHA